MNYQRAALRDPFARIQARRPRNLYGANSLEIFSGADGLDCSHEDADGFLTYPTSFPTRAANFWRKDAGVKVWAYEEKFDNWHDTYGMDAVMVFYHSGHGNMDRKGVFGTIMGAKWDGRDRAFSTHMAFANEQLRYLFWSTCLSLRVLHRNTPVRTWWNPNQGGLRMLFGYETTSVDDPNYGKFFWEEWQKGKPFARAFLDASWRISHDQIPAAMAAGSNQSDAINRLNNERFFSRMPVEKGWYQWQWIAPLRAHRLADSTLVPRELNSIVLGNKFADDRRIAQIARAASATRREANTIRVDANGNRMISSRAFRLNVNNEGALNLYFGKPNVANRNRLVQRKAIAIARRFISHLGLNSRVQLTLGNIRYRFTGGGTLQGSGRLDEPAAIETIVQFRQCHNRVESINSDHGLLTVGVDNDGEVVNVYDSTKLVLREVDQRTAASSSPRDPGRAPHETINGRFKNKIQKIVGTNAKRKTRREKVGYDFSSSLGIVVHQRQVEVDFGNNLKKRYKVRIPVM